MTKKDASNGFLDYFDDLPDHRTAKKCRHSMSEILLLTICAILSGCESWDDIELFGHQKINFSRSRLAFVHGVPSDDTLRRFFRALDPSAFQERFTAWAKAMFGNAISEQIAIDGKTLRGSRHGDEKALHIVGAYACEQGILLAQLATHEKSNEITAIPDLLNWLDVKNALVSIDAMGCQTNIANKIIEKGGDYFFSLKGNQSSLHDDIVCFFNKPRNPEKIDFFEAFDKGHGRIETRQSSVSHDLDWLLMRHEHWPPMKTIIRIDSKREIGCKVERETRYFISSRLLTAEESLKASRSHWGIENGNHLILDVSFKEDASQIAQGNAPENMGIMRRIALNMLKAMKPTHKRVSYKAMRKMAGWSDDFLNSIFEVNFMR